MRNKGELKASMENREIKVAETNDGDSIAESIQLLDNMINEDYNKNKNE